MRQLLPVLDGAVADAVAFPAGEDSNFLLLFRSLEVEAGAVGAAAHYASVLTNIRFFSVIFENSPAQLLKFRPYN